MKTSERLKKFLDKLTLGFMQKRHNKIDIMYHNLYFWYT